MAIIKRTKTDPIVEYTREEEWESLDSKTATSEDYKERLNQLQDQIELAKRTLSTLDSYKIAVSITNSNEAGYKISELLPNTAASIATQNSFTLNGEIWYRGDIAFKEEDGSITHIHSDTNGIYYPAGYKLLGEQQGETLNNTYQLIYLYSNQMPDSGSEDLEQDQLISKPRQEMNWNIGVGEPQQIYGLTVSISEGTSEYEFDIEGLKDEDGEFIKEVFPIIKFFDANDEEIIYEIKLEKTANKKWKLSQIPNIAAKIVIK